MSHETFVSGIVRPQGSMQLSRDPRTGKEFARYSDKTVMWRQTMHGHFSKWWAGQAPITAAVRVTVVATFARPKGHLGTGRNAGLVKGSAPQWHTSYPDLDKCCRAIGDSLVDAGVLADDCQIAAWDGKKVWCEPTDIPGARIIVEVLA